MFDYQIGGNAINPDASEGIADIPMNRSLFVQKLNSNPPVKMAPVYDLKNVGEVFDHFKPSVDLQFESEDGATANETLHFTNMGDFKSDNIVKQSNFLQQVNNQREDYQKMVKQLRTNKILGNVMNNPETKAAFLNALNALIQDLENS